MDRALYNLLLRLYFELVRLSSSRIFDRGKPEFLSAFSRKQLLEIQNQCLNLLIKLTRVFEQESKKEIQLKHSDPLAAKPRSKLVNPAAHQQRLKRLETVFNLIRNKGLSNTQEILEIAKNDGISINARTLYRDIKDLSKMGKLSIKKQKGNHLLIQLNS